MKKITQKEVLEILNIVRDSKIEELHLEVGNIKFHARKSAREKDVPPMEISSEAISMSKSLRLIMAPRLGFFRQAANPGDPPLVNRGQEVREDSPVGFIQVLEKMYPIPAGFRGRIAQIWAEDGKIVEYREPLFLVEENQGKE
jgi:acetyl-CoA carboxylase biotin carboxyl carrier protein